MSSHASDPRPPAHAQPAPLGIVGGSAFLEEDALEGAGLGATRGGETLHEVRTARGTVWLRHAGDFVFLRRHGEGEYRPPHRIPHHAHVLAMETAGVRQVVGLASTGSLDPELVPGDVVVPDDYLSRHAPPTFAADEYLHIVPELDHHARALLLQAARNAVGEGPGRVVEGGVYAETRGPRFETRAEVRALARDASVVGMTAASEATLFQERGIGYAVLCIVDNFAHGIGQDTLSLAAFQERQAGNAALARRILLELIGLWREQPERRNRA
jgi:5'-methylthioadenosine phosphorylase